MPIIKSAKKRVRVSTRASLRNKETKNRLRNALKSFKASLTSKKGVDEAYAEAQSALDVSVKKGIIHKNKAARKKAQLMSDAKNAGVVPKTAPKKATKPAKASTAEKPAAKKTVAKKAAAKLAKSPAKKPAKATAKKTTK